MKEVALVFFGGGLGSVCRFGIGKLLWKYQAAFPFATLVSNCLSCFIFGIVFGLGLAKSELNPVWKVVLLTGFCGGFSTYSAFTFETLELAKAGQTVLMFANILLNLVVCMTALSLGSWYSKLLL